MFMYINVYKIYIKYIYNEYIICGCKCYYIFVYLYVLAYIDGDIDWNLIYVKYIHNVYVFVDVNFNL